MKKIPRQWELMPKLKYAIVPSLSTPTKTYKRPSVSDFGNFLGRINIQSFLFSFNKIFFLIFLYHLIIIILWLSISNKKRKKERKKPIHLKY